MDRMQTLNDALVRVELVPRLTLTVREAAAALGLSKTTLFKLVAEGAIPCVRIGGARAIRFDVAALRGWLATGCQKTIETTDDPRR